MRLASSLLALLALASCEPQAAWAAGLSLTALTPHGTPAASDLIPCQPAAATTMLSCKVSDIQGAVTTSVKVYGAVGDGVTDDTVAIQTAINTGLPVYFPPGVYKTTATLNVQSYTNNGQVLKGAGSYYNSASAGFSSTPPAGTAVIRPTAAVSKVFVIDGTPVLGVATSWVQGFGIENLAIDMVNMTDAATSMAIQQIQAFDVHYTNVRVLNYGNLKESWNFQAGAYTTKLDGCQGSIVYFDGVTTTNATTTITIVSSDFLSIYHDHFQNITFLGGAVQQPYFSGMKVVYIPPGTTPYAYTTNATGLYGWVMSEINTSLQYTSIGTDYEQLGGYPATYNDGTHGTLTAIPVFMIDNTAINTTIVNGTFAGSYILDYGINTRIIGQGQSGVTGFDITNGTQYSLGDLRVVGTLSGPVGFGGALGSETSSSYSIVGSTGLATFQGETVKPASNGNAVNWKNLAGTSLLQLNTTTPLLHLDNGLQFCGYHDNATTLTWCLSDVSNAGKLVLNNAGVAQITLNSNGTIQGVSLYGTPVGDLLASTGAFTTLSASGAVSGAGFSTYLASPPAIGGSAAAAGTFTALNATASQSVGGKLLVSATAPTYSSGFSTGTPSITGSTTGAFLVTIGATPGATGVLTMPAAATGWVCLGVDRTTAAGTIRQTASATNSATFALASTVASDVLQFQCEGY